MDCSQRTDRRGFALVVTLSIMALLVVLAVGMLSLSAVTLRQSSTASAQAEARANARLALALALGELQLTAGPDRAITSTAGILAETPAKPHLTGVWESWWDFDPNASPDYNAQKTSRFRGWLVSSADPDAARSPNFVTTAWTGRTIELVGANSLGGEAADTDRVSAGLVPVTDQAQGRGGYAWQVADESVKARINLYRDPSQNTTLAQKRALLGGHRPDPSVIKGPDGTLLGGILPNDLSPAAFAEAAVGTGKIISLNQAELLDQAQGRIKPLYHHITPHSLGVLSDVRGGGLKQDLSSVFEMGNDGSNTLPADFSGRRLYESTHGITAASDPRWSALAGYYNSFRELTEPETSPSYAMRSGPGLTDAVPEGFNPAPVIAKVDTIFSLVGRPMTDVGWISNDRYDYFVDLVFTPVVTLHNPYNVNLSFHQMEVTFTNIPIAFNFNLDPGGPGVGGGGSKSVIPGTFDSLNTMAQNPPNRGEKKFVMTIANWADTQPLETSTTITGPIVMKPGQTLICGPSLPPDSSFFRDTRSGNNVTAYDWTRNNRVTEKIKAKPSFTPGIGYEITAVVISNTRPEAAMGSWCSYLMLRDQAASPKISDSTVTDRFFVEFKAQRPSYYTENLAQANVSFNKVYLPTSFGVTARLQAGPNDGLVDYLRIQFDYEDDSTLQNVFNDRAYRYPPSGWLTGSQVAAPGGVLYNSQAAFLHPFAIFSAYARTTGGGVFETGSRTPTAGAANLLRDGRLAGKPFLFHNPSRANFTMNLATEKPGVQPYELNFQPFLSQGDFEDYLDVDAANRVPSLTGNTSTTGIKSGSFLEIPSGPLQTIADFRRSNALSTTYQPHFVQPLGNSLPHPLMSTDRVIQSDSGISNTPMLDHSVLANHALYDGFYFSTFATRDGTGPDVVFEEFMNGTAPLASQAFQPYLPAGRTVQQARSELFAAGRPAENAHRIAAEYQMIQGAFNVNSTSVQAWMAVLAALRQSDVTTLWARSGALETLTASGTPIPGMSLPTGGPLPGGAVDGAKIDNPRTNEWNGYRELTDAELRTLAERIVDEVRARGPFLSMSEFVNRRIGPPGPLTLRGALEAAITEAEINEPEDATFPETFLTQVPITAADVSDPQLYAYRTPAATTGNPAAGVPGWVSQGDLLRVLEPGATVRGDTFVIRTYGESVDAEGNVIARAYAEAVVQRVPDYVDSADRPSVNAATDPSASPANRMFGRQFNVVSFRWLSADEI